MNLRHLKNEKGQALVEFAIVIPILLLLVFGIIQFGLIFNGQITVTNAAREGARLAVVGKNDEDVKDRVEETAVALLLNMTRDDIDITREGEKLTVKVAGTVDIIVPLLDVFTGDSYAVSSESVMHVE